MPPLKKISRETEEIQEGRRFSTKFSADRVVRVSVQKAVLILATAILGSAGAAIWGTLAVANTIPFRVDALEKDNIEIKANYQTKGISDEKWLTNTKEHQAFSAELSYIRKAVDDIRNLIK
jgi:hypothetical protein